MSPADRICAAWRLWRIKRLIAAFDAAYQAGRYQHARALLNKADAVLERDRRAAS